MVLVAVYFLPYKRVGGGGCGLAKINGPPDFDRWFQILAAHQREWEKMVGNWRETLVRDGKYYWGDKYWWE